MKRIFFAYLTFEFFFVLATLLTISCGRYHRAQLEYKLGEGDLLIYNATVSIFGQLGKLSNLNYQTAQTILLLVVAKDADASYRFGQISHGHDYFFGREKLEPLSNFCRYSQGALNISGPVAWQPDVPRSSPAFHPLSSFHLSNLVPLLPIMVSVVKLPGEMIAQGDTWKSQMGTCVLNGFKRINGNEAARINIAGKTRLASSEQSMDFKIDFGLEEGYPVNVDFKSFGGFMEKPAGSSNISAQTKGNLKLMTKQKVEGEEFASLKEQLALIKEGQELLDQAKLDEAEQIFQKCLQSYPESRIVEYMQAFIGEVDRMRLVIEQYPESFKHNSVKTKQ